MSGPSEYWIKQWQANMKEPLRRFLEGSDEERAGPDWEATRFVRAALVATLPLALDAVECDPNQTEPTEGSE